VRLAVVLELNSGLGGPIEEIDGERADMGEHGHEPSFEPAPEVLLLAVLVGPVRESGLVDDPEPEQSFSRLVGQHGGTVIGHERPRKTSLVEGLRQSVDEVLGRLCKIPLNLATKTGAVIENAERLWRVLGALYIHNPPSALVEIEMPEGVIVLGLEAPHFPFSHSIGRPDLSWSPR
jgi:hypothetical protein